MESVSVQALNASSPSKNMSWSVVSAASSSSSGSSSSSSMRRARASRRGSSVSAMSSIIAHEAAESVAPTNYYEGQLVRRGNARRIRQAHLVLGIGREILAVIVRRQHDASRRIWVLRCDDVRKVYRTVRCWRYETVLLYVPFEIAKSGNDVVADKSAVLRAGYLWIRFFKASVNESTHVF